MEQLILILEKSIEKNGTQPLTNTWLLNMLKLAERNQNQIIEHHDRLLDEAYMEILAGQCCDRD